MLPSILYHIYHIYVTKNWFFNQHKCIPPGDTISHPDLSSTYGLSYHSALFRLINNPESLCGHYIYGQMGRVTDSWKSAWFQYKYESRIMEKSKYKYILLWCSNAHLLANSYMTTTISIFNYQYIKFFSSKYLPILKQDIHSPIAMRTVAAQYIIHDRKKQVMKTIIHV